MVEGVEVINVEHETITWIKTWVEMSRKKTTDDHLKMVR